MHAIFLYAVGTLYKSSKNKVHSTMPLIWGMSRDREPATEHPRHESGLALRTTYLLSLQSRIFYLPTHLSRNPFESARKRQKLCRNPGSGSGSVREGCLCTEAPFIKLSLIFFMNGQNVTRLP